ncbi:MAG: tRNA (adenosine(37)-N6)-threonylcarbamoyltransferase complex dimerization subunit type 1 TsaB [Nitrospinota bacterium]|nr:MAG: tRNA (adenosine(37)-N6)-threonylcarbamoyltransferase complex dimerization subunit type 1 TsaB [Nitrospinota bacterium]
MRILGIDTATKTCGVAVTEGDTLQGMLSLSRHLSHTRQLLSAIHHLLTLLSLSLDDLDAFAITHGPGSFTGLRIGMATVEGLAVGLPRPVIGINTLEALGSAYLFSALPLEGSALVSPGNPAPLPVCPLLDARKGEVYAAIFTVEQGRMVRSTADMAIPPQELCAQIRRPTLFVGEGAEVYRSLLQTILGEKALFAFRSARTGCADMVARLAWDRSSQEVDKEGSPFALHYIRPSEAELQSQKHRQKK